MKRHKHLDQVFTVFCCASLLTLGGCGTVTTLAEHHSLEVSTKMSSSIFLDPTAQAQQTVFLQIRNTTDETGLDLATPLAAALQAKGWQVVTDPAQAHAILQVNVLQAGKTKQDALQAALAGGYGGVLGSAALGAGVAALAGANGYGIGGAGLATGAADYVGSLLVKDVLYAVITDVRVLERGAPGQKFTVTNNSVENNGTATGTAANPFAAAMQAFSGQLSPGASTTGTQASTTTQTYTTQSDFKTLQTRIISSAEQANLEWKDAEPVLQQGLVRSISGLF